MNAVAKFFLRAKHWQIFLIFLGLFFAGNLALRTSIVTTASSSDPIGKAFSLYGAVMLALMLFFLGWFSSMGSFPRSIVDPSLRLRAGFFPFALIYSLIYLPIFLALFERISANTKLFGFIFPLHLFAMYCLSYLLYFVSKSLVLVEHGKPVSFYDFAGPFFLLWFFPIGVWFVQPKVNQLYERRSASEFASGERVV